MKLCFTKMHGCGNDYIYIDGFQYNIKNPGELSKKLSDRHFSVGGDGVIIIGPSDKADAFMHMYNADGSEGKMCGNGVRCTAKFVHDNFLPDKDVINIETLSGVKKIRLKKENEVVTGGTVDMGKAEFDCAKIPALFEDGGVQKSLYIDNCEYKVIPVSMGNPHAVIFMDDDFDIDRFEIEKIGPKFEKNPAFPEGVNTEFVKVISPDTFKMRVWERGSGETLACGTGACAVGAAAVKMGIADEGKDLKVILPGGELIINYTPERVLLTGGAVTAFTGEVCI